MSNFSYEQYMAAVAAAQANNNGEGGGTKIAYVKLVNDGDIAIARLNIASSDELMFASVHQLNNVVLNGNKWPKISCHNPLGMGGSCKLCEMAAVQGSNVGKASKKVYLPMLVSYRDPQSPTGFTAPVPAIWERPAAFAREIANKLMVAGDLRNTLVLITRNGQKGDMQTTYSMDILPAEHPVFKPDLIPNDFSAFNNFNIAKHSYWEKTADEINTFALTGSFPEVNTATAASSAPATAPTSAVPNVNPVTNPQFASPTSYTPATTPATTPAYNTPVAAPAPVASPASATGTTPVRNFSGFSF